MTGEESENIELQFGRAISAVRLLCVHMAASTLVGVWVFSGISSGLSNCQHKREAMIRRFVCFWYFNGWDHISLGLHVDWTIPNIEIHMPFGFFRVGWQKTWPEAICLNIVNRGRLL